MKKEKLHDKAIMFGSFIVGIVVPLFVLGKALILARKLDWLMSAGDGTQFLVLSGFGLLMVAVSGFLVAKYIDSFCFTQKK